MATFSLIIALLALTGTGCMLYWHRRMRRDLSCLNARLLSSDQRQQLFEHVAQINPLRHRVDELKTGLDEEVQKLTLSGNQLHTAAAKIAQELDALRLSGEQLHDKGTKVDEELKRLKVSDDQLDARVANIEKACSGLDGMTDELQELQGFKDKVEHVHKRLREALSVNPVETKVTSITHRFGKQQQA